MEYKSNKPYPQVRVEKQNIEYAKLLLENYAGDVSEETAIHLYMYQNMITSDETEEYAKIIEQIGIVEMRHLSLLGKTIKLLGLKPVYGTLYSENYIKPWNSSNVNYATNIKEILIVNIKNETKAIENYDKRIMQIKDKYIRELLFRIIEDEKIHLEIFKNLYDNLK